MEQHIQFDPTDLDGMLALMDEYGESETLFAGENEDGERTDISIFKEKIMCSTMQQNGWVRRNIYWRDGTREEFYDGRWR